MSAYTLFDVAYRAARELGICIEGTATGGSTTTTIDTVYLQDRYDNDWFNAGEMFLLYDAGGAGGAPQGEWARITDFVMATGVVTHSAVTVAVAAGDRYALIDSEYTLDVLIANINAVLQELMIPTVDTTSLETDNDVTEYTLPAGVLDRSIKVWIQRNSTTSHNLWMEYHDWYIAETATGTAKKLIFRTQPPEPWDLKLEYWLPHTPLYARTDKLNEALNINRVCAEAALKCLQWKQAQKSQVDPVLNSRIELQMERVARMKNKYPNKTPKVKLATYGIVNNFDDMETSV